MFQNNEQTTNFEHLWEFTGKLGRFAQPGHLPANLSDLVIPLLNINKEGKLQREIKDIIDELDIMIYISTQQRDVIRKFKKEVTHLMDPHGTWKDKLTNASIGGTQRDDTQGDGTQVRDSQDMDTQCSGTEGVDSSGKDYQTRHDDYFWFVHSANELLGDVDNQIGELEGLKKSAVSTSTSVSPFIYPQYPLYAIPKRNERKQSLIKFVNSWTTFSISSSSRLLSFKHGSPPNKPRRPSDKAERSSSSPS